MFFITVLHYKHFRLFYRSLEGGLGTQIKMRDKVSHFACQTKSDMRNRAKRPMLFDAHAG